MIYHSGLPLYTKRPFCFGARQVQRDCLQSSLYKERRYSLYTERSARVRTVFHRFNNRFRQKLGFGSGNESAFVHLYSATVKFGIAYDIPQFDNKFVEIFKAPGKLIQKTLTTREPDGEMLEVAIAAFKKVLEMDADPLFCNRKIRYRL